MRRWGLYRPSVLAVALGLTAPLVVAEADSLLAAASTGASGAAGPASSGGGAPTASASGATVAPPPTVSGAPSAPSASASASASAPPVDRVARAIRSGDLELAGELLDGQNADSAQVLLARGTLALYRGDCHAASVILEARSLDDAPGVDYLRAQSKRCAGATVGARWHHFPELGVSIRPQDARDEALLPWIAEVADASLRELERSLGLSLPRPVRIDLVRDAHSLSAVSGLPLSAAETTGTVGVARFSRVIMVTPRAAPGGYPWADTLAHELAHLVLTAMSADRAPLWLQEGVAKAHERAWRPPLAFDETAAEWHTRARDGLALGSAVEIDEIGASIALLPSREQASLAYASVASFVEWWTVQRGGPALQALLLDLRGLDATDPDPALRSVTAWPLAAHKEDWKRWLAADAALSARAGDEVGDRGAPARAPTAAQPAAPLRLAGDAYRNARLAELLSARGHLRAAEAVAAPLAQRYTEEPTLLARWASTLSALGLEASARAALAQLDEPDAPAARWYALVRRLSAEDSVRAALPTVPADDWGDVGVWLDPYDPVVACAGLVAHGPDDAARIEQAISSPRQRALCEAAPEAWPAEP